MNDTLVKSNQYHIEAEIRRMLAVFCDEIIKQNREIKDLKERLTKTDSRRVEMARAYASKIGLLITKNKYEKLKAELKEMKAQQKTKQVSSTKS